jgi:hypothetical protein
VAAEERERGRLLRRPERVVVAAAGEAQHRRLAAGAPRQRPREGLHAGVERVAEAGRDADRDAGERGRVGHRVVGGEVGRRRVRAGVGRPRLGVAGPDGRADRGGRADQVRALLGQQQRAVAAHRDAHHADPMGGPEAATAAHRHQLVGQHRLRVVARVRVPVTAAAVHRHQGHRRQRGAADPERDRAGGRQAGQRAGVVAAGAVQHDHQRQLRTGPVPGRVADRVADGPVPGLRVERARDLRAGRGVGRQAGGGHRAGPVERVELALAGQVAAADELGPAEAGHRDHRDPGQAVADEETPRSLHHHSTSDVS